MYKLGIAILMVITCACGRNPVSDPNQDDQSATDDHGTPQITLFSETTEFFIEHDPPEAGKEAEFLVHVTNLQTYKPYTSGNLTILIDGVSVTAEKPERPGIFHIPFMPKRAGEFDITYTLISGRITESVTDHIDIHQDDEEPDDHEEMEPVVGEIVFLKEQAWKSDFMVEEVQPVPFSSVISTSGEILAMPGEKKYVAANSGGIILFNVRNLVQGSRVEKGQHLFTISSKALTEDNVELKYLEYLNTLSKSKSEYERYRELYASNVISERQFIESRTNYTADSIRFYNLAANTSEDGLKVDAPVSGYIHELNVSEGQFVDLGQNLATISSNKILLLRADVPQQYYYLLEDIVTANFRLAYSNRTYTVEELNGRLLAKGSSVAENDHYMPVYFEVENNGNLLEGAFAEFFLKTRQKDNIIVSPVSAILEEQGVHYLYIQVTGESFTKRSVSLGENDGIVVEIIEGLNPGERIVTDGVMLLKAASMVTGDTGDGHNH
jgi:cobalt-zinc-cadmium efflux system membrane fusion protein